ncbi:MAG: metallophosphoesterase [Ruminococcus sp.]|nr:metallophosphoesterase [Ruminococcus sp.]
MITNKKKPRILLIILCLLLLICIGTVLGGVICNKALELNTYTVASRDLPESFQGFRIAHVSDLHNATFGKDNEKLLDTIRETNPHIIAITGDIVDCRRTDVDVALNFVKKAVEIAPCYYVTGNHEMRVPDAFATLLAGLEEAGVTVLRNQSLELEKDGDTITLLGVDDPDFTYMSYSLGQDSVVDSTLKEITPEDESEFTLLLSHRPELFDVYEDNNIDLVLSGHAHGGQFRLPFVGGLYAPHQGVLPEYDSGLYSDNGTNLIVSRGIGNSLFPLRLFNPPEVILVELSKA